MAVMPKLFKLADFNRPKLPLDLPTVLYGATSCGKSEYALAHFDRPCVIRRPDDLKRVSAHTDGLVFDDCDFRSWSPEDTICLRSCSSARLGSASDKQLRCDQHADAEPASEHEITNLLSWAREWQHKGWRKAEQLDSHTCESCVSEQPCDGVSR